MTRMKTGWVCACGLGLAVIAGMHPACAAGAEMSAAYCRRVGTDDRVRPLPAELIPAFRRAFDLQHAPADYIAHTGFVRCADGVVMGCGVGANLPCGKADTRRDIPGADTWCRDNGDPAMIPAYVTGHASIYEWRCEGGRAVPVRQVQAVDARGFVARFWRKLDPASAEFHHQRQ